MYSLYDNYLFASTLYVWIVLRDVIHKILFCSLHSLYFIKIQCSAHFFRTRKKFKLSLPSQSLLVTFYLHTQNPWKPLSYRQRSPNPIRILPESNTNRASFLPISASTPNAYVESEWPFTRLVCEALQKRNASIVNKAIRVIFISVRYTYSSISVSHTKQFFYIIRHTNKKEAVRKQF